MELDEAWVHNLTNHYKI